MRIVVMTLIVIAFVYTPMSAASAPGAILHYDYSATDKVARDSCFVDEANARHIPLATEEYRSWFDQHQNTVAYAEWSRAVQRCQTITVWRDGKWNWGARILVGES